LADEDIIQLFSARGGAYDAIVQAADEARRKAKGDTVTYVVNCNINYTNICTYACGFCAFSKTSAKGGLRDKPYNLDLEEIAERTRVARRAGATEVCLQGGIHPSYTGETYLDILRTIKRAIPDMHVHAFSPLEVSQGAKTFGRSISDYLKQLKDEGLGSLPGTAAEILADEARAILCPDKLSKREWLEVVGAAHRVGLPTTSTIMFGHVDRPDQWADHINSLRKLQNETGGITEFVPLPYVHMASPLFVKGLARKGPTWRETVLMHAIARLALAGAIDNIQVSWVKLGAAGAAACLDAGVNDLGGVLMYESISRAAGAKHGQEMDVESLLAMGESAGRPMQQRSTLYGRVENPPKREEGVRAT
jgi:FO synthase